MRLNSVPRLSLATLACAIGAVAVLAACESGQDPIAGIWGTQESRDQEQLQLQKVQDEQESTDLDGE